MNPLDSLRFITEERGGESEADSKGKVPKNPALDPLAAGRAAMVAAVAAAGKARAQEGHHHQQPPPPDPHQLQLQLEQRLQQQLQQRQQQQQQQQEQLIAGAKRRKMSTPKVASGAEALGQSSMGLGKPAHHTASAQRVGPIPATDPENQQHTDGGALGNDGGRGDDGQGGKGAPGSRGVKLALELPPVPGVSVPVHLHQRYQQTQHAIKHGGSAAPQENTGGGGGLNGGGKGGGGGGGRPAGAGAGAGSHISHLYDAPGMRNSRHPFLERSYSVLQEPDPTDTDAFFSMEPSERCRLLMLRNARLEDELERTVENLEAEKAMISGLHEALAAARKEARSARAAEERAYFARDQALLAMQRGEDGGGKGLAGAGGGDSRGASAKNLQKQQPKQQQQQKSRHEDEEEMVAAAAADEDEEAEEEEEEESDEGKEKEEEDDEEDGCGEVEEEDKEPKALRRGGVGGWKAAKQAILDLDQSKPKSKPKVGGGGGGRGQGARGAGRGRGGRSGGRIGRGRGRHAAAEDSANRNSSEARSSSGEEEEEDGGGGSKRRQNKFGRDTSGLDPDALDIVMGNGVRRGVRTATELGNAYFALEDETPFIIGHKLHVYGNQLVALNIWHLPGLKLRSKLREGTRLWLDPISEDERDTMQEELMSRCELVLNALQRHRFYGIFANPVDPVMLGIPDYLDVIKDPMDLGTVSDKLRTGEYKHPREFEFGCSPKDNSELLIYVLWMHPDCGLTFQNCKTYNSPGTGAHAMGDAMLKEFEKKWIELGFC